MTIAQDPSPAAPFPVAAPAPAEDSAAAKTIKVLVWDLDNTLWDGTLLEGDRVRLRPGARELLETLDRRGILHSIASKNDPEAAHARLAELGVADYFLYPQIHWSAKSQSVARIAEDINVGLDTIAFVDDQPFERDEVAHVLPAVRCYDAADLAALAHLPELVPRFVTDESAIRRRMMQADVARKRAEEEFSGPSEEFLAGLGMAFTIQTPAEADLQRAEELTVRTHQLNTTGITYSYDELAELRTSPDHLLRIASLEDRYGTYGKIGLAVVEKAPEEWTIKLLLMSCRVMSRGVGTILMNHLMTLARDAGVRLRAEFRHNGRNRMMFVTYRLGGFRQVAEDGDRLLLEHDLEQVQPFPDYVDVRVLD
ncbi:MAG TPA: HAD-IIIC family phosphatase [Thermoanaerobaculia bacterium]|nr:HAD-IIIC family phosphatase [Thermoanaerobaculia bacterium]